MTDLVLSDELDLMVENGDWVAGVSDEQHVGLLLLSHLGDWRSEPTAGVGLSLYVNSRNPGTMLAEIRQQVEADGADVQLLTVDGEGKILIAASYE